MAALAAPSIPAILDAFDFNGFRRVVDLGGGDGTFLAAVLHANLDSSGVLFDLPHVVAQSGPKLTAPEISARVAAVGGTTAAD